MKFIKAVLLSGVMMILILDNRCAINGAAEGINLCLKTVIPSLFPFFVLSSLLTSTVTTLPRPIQKLFKITPEAVGALLSGLLGGYPIGAKAVSQYFKEGAISHSDAQRLLPICNQCGPAFIFGITACLFDSPAYGAMIWAIHIFSAILLSRILPSPVHRNNSGRNTPSKRENLTLSAAMLQSIRSMATVCGWIVMFRVLYCFLDKWLLWFLPQPVRICLCGLLELANGCAELSNITDPSTRFILVTLLTGFGGFCVSLQAFSLIHSDIDTKYYFPGKLTQAGISTLLASILTGKLYLLGGIFTIAGLAMLAIMKTKKKTVAIPRRTVYNGVIKEMRIELCSSEKR